VGVYGRTVPDAALIGRALIGFDALDFDAKPAAGPRIGLYRTPQWSLAEPPMASAFEESAGKLERAGARVRQITAPPRMDDIVLAADAINDYETYRSLAYERMHHAELLSPTMTNKLNKAAGVTRARYLEALANSERVRQAARRHVPRRRRADRAQRNRRSARRIERHRPHRQSGPRRIPADVDDAAHAGGFGSRFHGTQRPADGAADNRAV
jgi:Asp-tRNA(Asn)/Glu-tRNA(Gln) amidotransferase A subunit family amidase